MAFEDNLSARGFRTKNDPRNTHTNFDCADGCGVVVVVSCCCHSEGDVPRLDFSSVVVSNETGNEFVEFEK